MSLFGGHSILTGVVIDGVILVSDTNSTVCSYSCLIFLTEFFIASPGQVHGEGETSSNDLVLDWHTYQADVWSLNIHKPHESRS